MISIGYFKETWRTAGLNHFDKNKGENCKSKKTGIRRPSLNNQIIWHWLILIELWRIMIIHRFHPTLFVSKLFPGLSWFRLVRVWSKEIVPLIHLFLRWEEESSSILAWLSGSIRIRRREEEHLAPGFGILDTVAIAEEWYDDFFVIIIAFGSG